MKNWKAAFSPSTHKLGTTHRKSSQALGPEPSAQRTVQETPRHCDCTNRAADRSWLDREADIRMFLSAPGIITKDQLRRELGDLTLALTDDRFPRNAWTHVYTDGSAEKGMKNGGSRVFIRYPDSDTTFLSAWDIKNFSIHFLTSIDLDEIQCVTTTFWFVEAHAE